MYFYITDRNLKRPPPPATASLSMHVASRNPSYGICASGAFRTFPRAVKSFLAAVWVTEGTRHQHTGALFMCRVCVLAMSILWCCPDLR